jgi:hypothetical protein
VVTDWPGRPAAGHAAAPGPGGGGIEPNLPQPDDTRARQTNLFSPQRRRAAVEAALAGPSPAWRQRIEPYHRRPEDISDLGRVVPRQPPAAAGRTP